MKMERKNPNKMSQVEMMNNQSMMGMSSFVQKLGKGKRKYNVKIEKATKKFLAKLSLEMKKQIISQGVNAQTKSVISFFEYLEKEGTNKEKVLKLSYEELEFLKQTIFGSIKQMDTTDYKWYQFIKKIIMKMMVVQYKALYEELKK